MEPARFPPPDPAETATPSSDPPGPRHDEEAATPPGPPLEGRTIVITRSEDRSDELSRLLEALGARVLSIPAIRFAPAEDPGPLRSALDRLESFSWILFTSATGVHYFFQAVREMGIPASRLAGRRFGAVGPATAAALAQQSFRAEKLTLAGDAAAMARALVGPGSSAPLGPADACLLPQAEGARPELAEALRGAGVPVTAVTAYRTLAEDPAKAEPFLRALEGDEGIDGIAFASPSAVRSFLAMTHPHGELSIREKPICVFSIGPTTSRAIHDRGLRVAREASPHTSEALARAIVEELSAPS